MSFITESTLANVADLPITIPVTELNQGDWLVVATIKVISPLSFSYRYLNISLISSSVTVSSISNSNKIFGNQGLIYVALRKDYASGSPGAAGALDVFGVNAIGTFARPSTPVITVTEPGVYSWVIANNMQPSSTSPVPTSTSIDFTAAVTGFARIELISS